MRYRQDLSAILPWRLWIISMMAINRYYVAAATVSFLLGLVHSVLGEKRIFRRWRYHRRDRHTQKLPSNGAHLLQEAHIGILWASWHLVSIFGLAMSAVLLYLAWPTPARFSIEVIPLVLAIAALAGATGVFIGTRGKHPGWLGLLIIAVCVWIGNIGNVS